MRLVLLCFPPASKKFSRRVCFYLVRSRRQIQYREMKYRMFCSCLSVIFVCKNACVKNDKILIKTFVILDFKMPSLFELFTAVPDKESAVTFLQRMDLLYNPRLSENGHEMTLTLSDKEDRWRCNRSGCRSQKHLKAGTWFHDVHLSYRTAIFFIYCWSHEMTTIKFCERESSELHVTL